MAEPLTPQTPADADALRERVRERYAAAAVSTATGATGSAGDGCCRSDGDSCCSTMGELITPEQRAYFGQERYDATETAAVPDRAALASLGCGNPVAVAELHPGETVLDLGSGGGLDVLLSARRVGPDGLAYGLDMTDEMLELARRNQAEAGVENVRWLRGHIEALRCRIAASTSSSPTA